MILEPATPDEVDAVLVAVDHAAQEFRRLEAVDPLSFGHHEPGRLPIRMEEAAVDPGSTALGAEGRLQRRVSRFGTSPKIDDLQAERPRGEEGEMCGDLFAVGLAHRGVLGVGEVDGDVLSLRLPGGHPVGGERVRGEQQKDPEQ